ncbi:MAG: GlsB/YeaQ/YmgE family stress response membrane protein [Sphingomonas sp.]|uniref:GlsB/YeaQ/YmgE family stress response membrane protein n=1 Tax=Sphingomonas sp. TaxID=28214 RepID=UPI0012148EED|nr:GlsB/YeaQ/YmgE family stress response membrane protein [Sphingomonas sp.]THD38428.1 MAG: GlsB/YeaQ/YmgE family stress response membrane protein [Sphingomonas sp.]
MGIIIWLVVGGLAGWLASVVMRTDGQQGLLLNVVVGIVGAVIANLIFGVGINEAITVMTFVYSVIGAIILLAILNLINRGRVR